MGKRLIHQRRGRGTPVHRVASHRFKDKIRYRSYDALEKEGSIKGKVIDIVHDLFFRFRSIRRMSLAFSSSPRPHSPIANSIEDRKSVV